MSNIGTVLKKQLGEYTVLSDKNIIWCGLSSKLRKRLIYPTSSNIRQKVKKVVGIGFVDPVAIGDKVRFSTMTNNEGVIKEVLPRQNKMVRQATGPKPLEQIIAANVDQILCIISTAKPAPKWSILDRYLLEAEIENIPVIICITKMDIANQKKLSPIVATYRKIGYKVVLTSVITGEGIKDIQQIVNNRISVIVGMSGVGKTSLLNAVQPSLGLEVRAISAATGKGVHTTTHLEMFHLTNGGYMIDTPGVKVFGLWGIEPLEIAELFPEMRPFLVRCRFRPNCTHVHEPNCAVKSAVEDGIISHLRYKSYKGIIAKVRATTK